MKKRLFSAILLMCILFALSACGSAPQAAPSPASTPVPTAPAASAAPAAPSAVSTLPGSNLQPAQQEASEDTTSAVDEALLEAARACIDQDVSALYAAIGEPEDSSYASSCLGPGEDGELYYDGFTVATYREEGKEIVRDVNVNVG